jgi:vesicle transport protein SEC22
MSGVCYLTLTNKTYSSKMAFSFLKEIQQEFITVHGNEISTAERPYAFINFENFITKTKLIYQDSRTSVNIKLLKEELNEVQDVMKKNIEEVIGRGEKLIG